MEISTTHEIAGKRITKNIGVVTGNYLSSRPIGKEIAAGLKGLVGRDNEDYGSILQKARAEALHKLEQQASKLGANAIVGVEFRTEIIMGGVTAEFLAYGTAVEVVDA